MDATVVSLHMLLNISGKKAQLRNIIRDLLRTPLRNFSSVGGLEEEQDYEYHAVEGECHFNKKLTKATVESSFNITEGDEDQLTLSIAYFNPVSIAFEVHLYIT